MTAHNAFTVGDQPCDDFTPKMTYFGHNEHECWCIRPQRRGEDVHPGDCHGAVSFCLNCLSDHHSGGYETCPVPEPLCGVQKEADHG